MRTLLLLASTLGACIPNGYFGGMGGSGTAAGGQNAAPAAPAVPPPPEQLAATGAARKLTRVTYDENTVEEDPAPSPDGKWLLYTSTVPAVDDGQTQRAAVHRLMRSRTDGKAATMLTDESGEAFSASWMPNGASYVAVSSAMGGLDLVRALKVAPRTALTRILDNREIPQIAGVSVAPAGGHIAFHSSVNEVFTISTVKSDGSELTHLVAGVWPAWTPDGKQLVFHRFVGNTRQIFVTDAETGSELTQLTNGDDHHSEWPTVSPDGKYIAFVSNRGWNRFPTGNADHNSNLYLMRVDGSDVTQLTEGNHWVGSPRWGSDGWIYFASDGAGSVDIWRLQPDLAALSAQR